MIERVAMATLYCRDQDEAQAFYVDTLGLEVRTDVVAGDTRWLLVGPTSQPEFSIMLVRPDRLPAASAQELGSILERGGLENLTFAVDDCGAAVDRLRDAGGTEILHEASDHPLGVEAVVRDGSGNTVVLLEYRSHG